MDKKKKISSKIFSWIGFASLISTGLVAIGFGIANFVKYGSDNRSIGYSETLQTQLQISLNDNTSNNTLQSNLNEIESIGNKLSNVARSIDANDIKIQSGINESSTILPNVSNFAIGNIFIYTEKNLYRFNMDFDVEGNEDSTITDRQNLQSRLDFQRLSLYLTLAQTNTYQLVNYGLMENLPDSNNINFQNIYHFNGIDTVNNPDNLKTNSYLSNDNMYFDLRNRQNDNNIETRWDLSSFQKQFTEVYQWDGKLDKTRAEIVSENDSAASDVQKEKSDPKNSYILWKNRNGLVNLLQVLATVSYLNSNKTQFDQTSEINDFIRIQGLYDYLGSNNTDYQEFMEWCASNNSIYTWNQIMSILYQSLNYNFGIQNNQDPLISFLNNYYLSKKDSKYTKNNEFLYSWNFSSNNFLSPYLSTIDYNNWFNYFEQDATTDELDNVDYVKSNYFSNKFNVNWTSSALSVPNIQYAVDFANNSAINKPFINYYLLPIISHSITANLTKNVYNAFYNGFIDKTVSLVPSIAAKPLIGQNSFNGAIIAFSCLLLIIGIVVSILYRVPGALLSFGMFSSFGLTLLTLTSLSVNITLNTMFVFIISLTIPLLPFFYSFKKMKSSIEHKKLNINNSFKIFLSSFIWMSIMTYVTALIISLVILLFGKYQVGALGPSLIVVNFNSLVGSFVLFIILLIVIYYLKIKFKPSLMLNKNDINILTSIKNVTAFDNQNIVNENQIKSNFSVKLSNQIANGLLSKNIWIYIGLGGIFLISIIGIILLTTINTSNNSISFQYTNEISFTYNKIYENELNEIANALASSLNINWQNIYTYNLSNNMMQTVLKTNSLLNINDVFNSMNTISSSWLQYMVFKTTDTYFAKMLLNNGIECLLISLGFLAILNLFMLNIINIIPIFVISCLSNIMMIGILGIIQIDINLNVIESYICLFIINQIIIGLLFINIKKSFNLKKRTNFNEIYDFSRNELKKIFNITLLFTISYLLINIFILLFDTRDNYSNYLINGICNIFGTLFSLIMIPLGFSLFMSIREKYLSIVSSHNIDESEKNKKYDKVDEQIIVGINHN